MRLLAATAAGLLAATAAGAAPVIGSYEPLFQGIDVATVQIDTSRGLAARIDLTAPGIRFTASAPAPAGTPLAGNSSQSAETISQTTSQFLLGSGTQYAINAAFFDPCCTAANEGKHIEGLAISNGTVIAPLDPTRTASLLIGAGNAVTIGNVTSVPAGTLDAFTGSDILVRDGQDVAPTASTGFDNANPRTAAGVSEDGKTLYLLTVDGRQPGYSDGTSLTETADLLLALGAYEAVNLDGGGSTTAVESDGAGGARVLNRPSGGTERYVADSLGIFANPIDAPSGWAVLVTPIFWLIARAPRRR